MKKFTKNILSTLTAVMMLSANFTAYQFISKEKLTDTAINASAASFMKTAEAGINLIKEFEQCRLTAYKATSSEKYYTIGWGHYGADVTAGMTITQEQADQMFVNDLVEYENYVNTFLGNNNIVVNQNQFDALVSFTYNCGNVWVSTPTFQLKTYLINGVSNYTSDQITTAFTNWNKQNGTVLAGLTRRRQAEAALFLSGEVSSFPSEIDSSYSVPISVTADHRFNTYDSSGNIESSHYIDTGDNCTINQVYTNGFVNVTYPVSSGTRTAYAKLSDFSLTPTNNMPIGVVDGCVGGRGSVYLEGWCFDPDDFNAQLAVHIYLGTESEKGTCIGGFAANTNRPDVNNVYGCGDYHGYSGTIQTDIAPGTYFVRAAFLDSAGGIAEWADGGWITVEYNPETYSVNLGDNFDAEIICSANGRYVFASSKNDNVELGAGDLFGLSATKRIWNFARQPDNSYRITSYLNSKVMDTDNSNNEADNDGRNVLACDWHGGDNQRWFIIPNGDGYYLQPVFSTSRVLDISGGEMGDHSNIQIWEKNDSANQRFTINNVSGDTEAPVIEDVTISDITPDGYTVTIKASDNVGIKKIAVPTWTSATGDGETDWMDDLFDDWTNTAVASWADSGTWTYTVKTSEHNNECGVYNTDIYVWDFSGNETAHRGENNLRHHVKVGMYELTVDPNGGTIIEDGNNETSSVITCQTNLIYNTPNFYSMSWAKPKRNGYIFTGWYTAKTGGVQIHGADGKCVNEGTYFKDNLYQYEGNLTLYAHWEKAETKGDANGDNKITVADAVMLQKWLLGASDELTCWQNADLYEDGKIDVFDMVMLRKLLTTDN